MYRTRLLPTTVCLPPFVLDVFIPLHLVQRQALTPALDLPLEWSYKGYVDRVGKRALYRAMTSSANMSSGLCARWCSEQAYTLAGTEWSRECFCGYDIFDPVRTEEFDCSWPCSIPFVVGEACGASQRLSIYELDPKYAQTPTTTPGSGTFPSLGCYSDNVAGRSLPVQLDVGDGGLTVEKCIAACAGQGFAIAGVEYGQESFCGHALENGSAELTGCNMLCIDNSLEFCGGPNPLKFYGSLLAATSTPTQEITPKPKPTLEVNTLSVVPNLAPQAAPVSGSPRIAETAPVPMPVAEAPAIESTSDETPEIQTPIGETPVTDSNPPAPAEVASDESLSSSSTSTLPFVVAATSVASSVSLE